MSARHDHPHGNSHGHPHGRPLGPARRAVAADPTWSILRLSALQRLAGAFVLLVALWAAVASTVSWG